MLVGPMRDVTEPGAAGLTGVPLAGRDDEIRALGQAAQRVLDEGVARGVSVVGPSGVGKTSLIDHAIVALMGAQRYRVYRGGSLRAGGGPDAFASMLRSRFGVMDGSSMDDARAQIRTQVSSVLDDRKVGDVCYFLGQILDIPFSDSPLTKALQEDPAHALLVRRAIIRNFFESDAARGPICLVFDDIDAAGDDAIGFVGDLIEHLGAPILIVCSMRPEMAQLQSGWPGRSITRHDRVDLGPVSDEVARKLMHGLLAPCEGGPPEALVDTGVRLAEGNVGRLRAMVRLFHDSGVLDETGPSALPTWHVHLEKLSSVNLPLTVEETVSMRIASLTAGEQMLLERAAAMGSVFWVGALVAIERTERSVPVYWELEKESEADVLESRLEALVLRDYVLQMPASSFPGERQYAFKHKLERQKLSALTSAQSRKSYHQTIADWLAHRTPEHPSREHLVLSAYHLEGAGAGVSAGLLYLDAGDAARATYAARDAEEYYARGLALLEGFDAERRIDGLHNHGDVLTMLGRTDEALSTFREMLDVAYRLDIRAKGGAAHNRIGRLQRAMGSLAEARKNLETALALFESAGDERGVAACHDDVGMVLWTRGEYEAALERMRVALEIRKKLGDRRSIALSLHNIGVVWRDHGRPTQAQEALEASLQIRRELDDRLGIAQTLDSMGRLAQDQRDLPRARELFTKAHDVAREVGERNWIAVVLTNLGEATYRLGDSVEAIRILTEAESLCDELGDKLHLAEAKRALAEAYLIQGDLRKARARIKHAVDLFGQIRSKSHLATALRTLGEITAAGAWGAAHEGKAIDYFMRSIALCKEIGNEIEIAKSYRSFSDYVARSEHYQKNQQIQAEATKLREMSEAIFARQQIDAESAP
ncbi:MAG TPA: tetratricopeptide repeat protein [Polyangiaceae bacterium]|nr:tetratricopeptide repeat protein [Polyangiaceae bacterium]